MFRHLLPAFALLALPAHADDTSLCPLTADQDNCVRILACIGDHGRWFHGRAFGRGSGDLIGEMSDGVTCTGDWTSRNPMGLGQADVACDDGTTGTVLYTYQDHWTGTTTGLGSLSNGSRIEAWSGLNVLDYLDSQTGRARTLPCAAGDLLIS